MLLQGTSTFMFILYLIIATVIVTLIIFLAVRGIESEYKASDKKFMILLVAFIAVLILPYVTVFLNLVLVVVGNALVNLRGLIGGSTSNYLLHLTPIIYFLLLLVLVKVFIDLEWDSSVWVTLLALFVIYIIYTLLPELTFIRFGV